MVDGLETMPVPRPVALTTSTSTSASESASAASAASAAALASSASSASSTIARTIDQSASFGASVWYNLTAFAWAANVTRYAPILEDLVLAGPRIMMKLGSLMTSSEPMAVTVPQHATPSAADMSADVGAGLIGSLADDPSVSRIMEEAASFLAAGDQQQHPDQAVNAHSPPRLMSLDGARGLGSVFNYATSKWALLCIAMAIVLNRTHIFAATRRRLRFRWHVRLLLRIVPIVLFVLQARQLLRSIQCQTSPDFALLRWGDAGKSSDLMFAHPNVFLNTVSSAMLLGASDQQSCGAVYMVPPDDLDDVVAHPLRGSLSRLWPLFGTFCLSHFLETVSCAVQGRSLASETGMTLFEQSLAFAEADAAMSNRFSWGSFPPKPPHMPGPAATSENAGTGFALTRSMILRRVNTSPEVLLIAFLSSMTHITSHVLGIFDLQAKYRLLNTGFWGLCFMASIVWSALVFDLDDPSSQALWRFPTVCIIGFVPHVLVLAGIVVCVFIYGLALLLSALVPPANEERSRMSLRQRIGYAHENMQANLSLSEVRITREMDFYAALLRTGFAAITMASEAVYLNEDGGVNLKRHTWLEEARYREAEELQRQWIGMGLSDSRYGQIGAIGLIPVKGGPVGSANGYGRERAAQKVPRGRGDRCLRMGIGASERSSRWLLALDFLLSINKLLARVAALTTLWFLGLLRIRRRPALLVWLAQGNSKRSEEDDAAASASVDPVHASHKRGLSGSAASGKNEPSPPAECIDDVEAEFRRVDQSRDEESLDSDLYKYWLIGGWWGSKDASGDFQPSVDGDDWDVTSVVTMTTNNERDDVGRADADDGDGDEQSSGWTSEDSGQRTPTQQSPQRTRENTPFLDSPLGMRDLARLLRPSNPEEREEAERLAAHLQSDGILTRSGFRRVEKLQRTRILTMPGAVASSSSSSSLPSSSTPHKRTAGPAGPVSRVVKLSPEEEEQLLEQLLLSRRQATTQDDGSGEGDGPPCVVCQCAPRTVIVWPCRCLSLCDDCRVSLAMNNFDKCVCCRRDVMSFSRIYMP